MNTDNLLNLGLPRIVAAFVSVGIGPVTVTVYNGTTWPVKFLMDVIVVPFSSEKVLILTHSPTVSFASNVQFVLSLLKLETQDAAWTIVAVRR